MKFISESDLELYYDKEFDEISPNEKPVSYYMNGGGVMNCKECGKELFIACHSEFIECSYCTDCEIEFKRNRKPVVDDVEYQYSSNRPDKREDYSCTHCGNRHPMTEPDSDWKYIKDASIFSYESVTINCPCGKQIPIDNIQLSTEISCDKCSRTFKLISEME